MFERNIQHTFKSPLYLLLDMFQPILYMVLFMPLLGGLGGEPGLPAGKTVQIFIPGLLVMMSLFGSAFVGYNLIDDIRSGVVERFLVTPVKRSAILAGRVLHDAFILLLQVFLITIVAIPFGLSISFWGFLVSIPLYIMIAISMASMSYAFALIYKTEDNMAPTLNTITLPVSLLSGIMLPLALAPFWLLDLAKINPFYYTVNASRDLFAGAILNGDVVVGFIVTFLLMSAMFYWSVRALRKIEE